MRGETRHILVRLHTIVLVRPLAEVIAGAVVAAFLTGLAPGTGFGNLVALGLLAVVTRAVYLAVAWDRERITITDRRLLRTKGVFTAQADVMPISKVTDLSFQQSFLGLLLGYGYLVIESAGQNQALSRLGPLPRPREVYEDMTQVVHARPGGAARPPAPRQQRPSSDRAGGQEGDDLLLPEWVNDSRRDG